MIRNIIVESILRPRGTTELFVLVQAQDQSVYDGQEVTFIVVGSGTTNITYQWQVSTDGGSNWSNIVSETSSEYTFTVALADDSKQYRAVVSGDGFDDINSDPAVLTVSAVVNPSFSL